jgi:putative ABC transport system permease protein
MRLLRRIAYWLRLSSHADDLQAELAFHRDMIERDLIAKGVSPVAARDEARRTMGNETFQREESRAVWFGPALDAVLQDARYTVRDLRRSPTFTIGVVLTLALGIGANAAMFGFLDRLLLRAPAHLVDPASVNRVYYYRTTRGKESEAGGIYARYLDLVKWSSSLSQAAGYVLRPVALGVGNDTELRNVGVVSASFFSFFDSPPLLGRYFTAAEDMPPSPAPVAVLSEQLWKSRFASRPDVLGQTLQIDAILYTIIGVARDDFVGLWPNQPPAVFVPVATFASGRGNPAWATSYGTAFGLNIMVRRKPGVTAEAAAADLTSALRRSYQAAGGPVPLDSLRPRALATSILPDRGPRKTVVQQSAKWLTSVAAIVLMIACANVANLLLARTIRRRREIALRIALGVSRARLFAQLLTEGIVLGLLGGAVGLVVAVWGVGALRAMFQPAGENAPLLTDARTLLFCAATAIGAGVLAGLAPMTQLGRANLTSDLKAGAREGGFTRSRVRTALVLVQCALSVILLVGAGLFVESLRHVRDVRLGFDADSVLVVTRFMRNTRLDSASNAALRRRLLESVKDVPGVVHASLQMEVPFDGGSQWPIFVPGIDSAQNRGQFWFDAVSEDYFKTMGTRIMRGRAIEATDVGGAPLVVVVGQSMAAALWPSEEAIGRCLKVGLADTVPCRTVVGVAEDIHPASIDNDPKQHFYYLPATQWQNQSGGLFVRARGNAAKLAEPVRRRLQEDMLGTSYITVEPLGEIVDASLRSWIVGARVFTGFGLLALLLAAVGLYSVIAYNVTQRRHELGVRLALGASRPGIVQLVVMHSFRLASVGIAIGALIAAASVRYIAPLLYKQSPYDPRIFALGGVVLLGVSVVAGWIPALRAASVDPKAALQAE